MKSPPRTTGAQAFFLKAKEGERFCLYHAPASDKECRGSILYVHPFGEEMNKSRRMAALQARAFSALGFAVLQIDLLGCGDSSGDFSDARWNLWKEDLALALGWLSLQNAGPVSLWGLRLGALLALDFAGETSAAIERIILWQALASGESFLTQFLRMRLASGMLAGEQAESMGTQGMRQALAAGESLEIAGYELHPALAADIDRIKTASLVIKKCPVHWFEIVPEHGRPMTPVSKRIIAAWKQSGLEPHSHIVTGPSFWSTQEISECPALIAATNSLFMENRS